MTKKALEREGILISRTCRKQCGPTLGNHTINNLSPVNSW